MTQQQRRPRKVLLFEVPSSAGILRTLCCVVIVVAAVSLLALGVCFKKKLHAGLPCLWGSAHSSNPTANARDASEFSQSVRSWSIFASPASRAFTWRLKL